MLMLHHAQMREIADLLESGRVYDGLLKVYEYGQLPDKPDVLAVYPEKEEDTQENPPNPPEAS